MPDWLSIHPVSSLPLPRLCCNVQTNSQSVMLIRSCLCLCQALTSVPASVQVHLRLVQHLFIGAFPSPFPVRSWSQYPCHMTYMGQQ